MENLAKKIDLNENKSREECPEETEKDYPVWMVTSSVADIIQDINLDGMVPKQNPDPTKENLDLNSRNIRFDVVSDSTRRPISNDFPTRYADNGYVVDFSEKDRDRFINMDGDEYKEKRTKILDEKIKNDSVIKEEIRDAFEGQIVVDLAAGDNVYGYLIADQAMARAYVGVEPYNYDGLFGKMHNLFKEKEVRKRQPKLNGIPLSIVAEDMLSFLKRLPDNSVSIWCSGIDFIVIPDREYHKAVAKEIFRVLDPKGAYIGGRLHIDLPSSYSDDSYSIDKKVYGKKIEDACIDVFRKKEILK